MQKAYKFGEHIGYSDLSGISQAECLAKEHGATIYGWAYYPKPYENQRMFAHFFNAAGNEVAIYYPASGGIEASLLLHTPPRIWADAYKNKLRDWCAV